MWFVIEIFYQRKGMAFVFGLNDVFLFCQKNCFRGIMFSVAEGDFPTFHLGQRPSERDYVYVFFRFLKQLQVSTGNYEGDT